MRRSSPSSSCDTALLRSVRECRQLSDVAWVVLNDDLGFQICRYRLDALERGHGLRAIEVEARDPFDS